MTSGPPSAAERSPVRTAMRSSSSSPCGGIVVEQHELLRTRLAGDVHRVVDGRVAPVPLRLVLLGRVLRVVDQQVDAVAELEDVVRHVVVGIVGAAARPVVGNVRDRPAAPLDAEAERQARRGARTASAPSRGRSGKSSSPVSWNRTSAFSPSGRIGKNGGHMIRENTSPSGAVGLARAVDVERRGRGCATARRTAALARGPSAGASAAPFRGTRTAPSWSPYAARPVPRSNTIGGWPSRVTDTHDECPP